MEEDPLSGDEDDCLELEVDRPLELRGKPIQTHNQSSEMELAPDEDDSLMLTSDDLGGFDPGPITHAERTFENWLKKKWRCKMSDPRPVKGIILGKNPESEELMRFTNNSSWMWREMIAEFNTYETFANDTGEKKSEMTIISDHFTFVVMLEPGNNKEEMEQCYQKARKQGMPVLLAWDSGKNYHVYMNPSSMEPGTDDQIVLFDDSSASKKAAAMIGKKYECERHISEEIMSMMKRTIFVFEALALNPEALLFYEQCGVNDCRGGWMTQDKNDVRHNSMFHFYTDIVKLSDAHMSSNANNYEIMVSSDLNHMLFLMFEDGEREDYLNPQNSCFYMDLTDNPVELVKKEPHYSLDDSKSSDGDGTTEIQWLRYRTKKGDEFMFRNLTGLGLIFCQSPVTFSEMEAVIQSCWPNVSEPLDSATKRRVKQVWDNLVLSGLEWDELKETSDALSNSDEFIPIYERPLVDAMKGFWDVLQFDGWIQKTDFVLKILVEFGDRIKDYESDSHWVQLLTKWKYQSLKHNLKAFKQGVLTAGMAPTKDGRNVVDYAIETGDSGLIRAAKAFEKSQKSSSTLEENTASDHSRWTSQSEYFVKNYILSKENGKRGEECVKVLRAGLIRLIQDRGDFTAVDLMGIVWHSSEENRAVLWKKLEMAMKTTLDYNTVHSDKVGWEWVRDVVMQHPVWLTAKKEGILFDELVTLVDEEAREKGGSEITDAFTELVKNEPEQWKEVCGFDVAGANGPLRQDEIENGPKPGLSETEIREISLRTNSLDFNIRKIYDSKAYLTETLTTAHLVNPNFCRLMSDALSGLGKVQFGPVKQASRVEPKSEEYAGEDKPHCRWPYSACVIDLVRCSLTVSNLAQMHSACVAFKSFVDSHSDVLSICRCKNGFSKYAGKEGSVPCSYTDVKLNVACKSEDGSRAIIGEVQILLQCVLDAKLKAHELYEVSRSLPLYRGAAHRLQSEFSFTQQLLLTGGSERLLVRPLTLSPFRFSIEKDPLHPAFDLMSFLLKADFKSCYVIDDLAKAVVDKSNPTRMDGIITLFLSCFEKFKTNRSFFGSGSGQLLCAILTRIAALRGSDANELILDVYRQVCDEMKKHEFDMDSCFNLFTDLDHSIKARLKWNKYMAVQYFKHFPRNMDAVISVYDGFKKITGFESFLHRRHPWDYDEYDKENPAAITDAVRKVLNKLWKPGYRVSSLRTSFIPYLVDLEPILAAQVLGGAKDEVGQYIRELITQQSLAKANEFLANAVDPTLLTSVFLTRPVMRYIPFVKKTDISVEELKEFQKYNLTIDMFDIWMHKYYWYREWSKKRRFFPEVYFVSQNKRDEIFKVVCQTVYSLDANGYAGFFGDERSEECRSMMVAENVTHFVNRLCENGLQYQKDMELAESSSGYQSIMAMSRINNAIRADDAIPFIIRLLPNKEWPSFEAMLESGDIKDENALELLNEILDWMPEVNKRGSLEEYEAWKSSNEWDIALLKQVPFHSAVGIVGDSERCVRSVIQVSSEQERKDGFAAMMRAEWTSAETAAVMAAEMLRSLQFESETELSAWMLARIDRCLAPIRFGRGSGFLLIALFQLLGARDIHCSADESKMEEDPTDWERGCVSFLNVFLTKSEPYRLELFNLLKLFQSLPDSVVTSIPKAAVSRILGDKTIRIRPLILRDTRAMITKLSGSLSGEFFAAEAEAVLKIRSYHFDEIESGEGESHSFLEELMGKVDSEGLANMDLSGSDMEDALRNLPSKLEHSEEFPNLKAALKVLIQRHEQE